MRWWFCEEQFSVAAAGSTVADGGECLTVRGPFSGSEGPGAVAPLKPPWPAWCVARREVRPSPQVRPSFRETCVFAQSWVTGTALPT